MIDRLSDGSVLVTAARRTRNRLRTAMETARVGRLVPRSIGVAAAGEGYDSRLVGADSRLASALRGSRIATGLERARARIESSIRPAAATARVTAVGESLRRSLRTSALYRWLTAEPEPDVIVIDLRKTVVAGAVLGLTYRTLAALRPGVESAWLANALHAIASTVRRRPIRLASLVLLAVAVGRARTLAMSSEPEPVSIAALGLLTVIASIGLRSRTTWNDVREGQAMSVLAAAFEPPEPPERPGVDTDEAGDGAASQSDASTDDESGTPHD